MSQYHLDRIFEPCRIAVVGASEKSGSIGNALMKNLIQDGFSGELPPINPQLVHDRKRIVRGERVNGLRGISETLII